MKSSDMLHKYGRQTAYVTPPQKTLATFPTVRFFSGVISGPLIWLWSKARSQKCDDPAWVEGSAWVGDIFEDLGGQIRIAGMEHLHSLSTPCVFVANHMSTLETFLLPAIIRPWLPITFVVKKSLTTMPIFGPIMRSRDPVIVDRLNPRDDLKVVLEEGNRRLANGISVIVFPQHTRSLEFDESQFNSIGVKLAAKGRVPIVPIALKTDAWSPGKHIKELGPVRPHIPVRFQFGQPLAISGKGREEHAQICQFIRTTLEKWQLEDRQGNQPSHSAK